MIEAIKKTLLAGLGAAGISQEKLKGLLDELVRQGELTEEQGKKLLDELLTRGRSESRAVAERVTTQILYLLEKGPFVTRREFHLLETRVRSLEASLGAAVPDEVEPLDVGDGTAPDIEV